MTNAEYQKARIDEKRKNGICVRCKNLAPAGKRVCEHHRITERAYLAEWHKKQVESGLCTACHSSQRSLGKMRCPGCIGRSHENNLALKRRVFAEYGDCCECCGERRESFLTLDHINNDGEQDRREIGDGQAFYRWLENSGFPKGNLRILCFNCNCGRRVNGGVCPHREEK